MGAEKDTRTTRRAVLGLGANLGSREGLLRAAVDLLGEKDGLTVTGCSRLWETTPVGPAQPDYLNAAVLVHTTLPPHELLNAALAVEATLGRTRTVRWGPRTIDLDVLWIEGVSVMEEGLTVPHPRLRERAFALGPMLEACPDADDPVTGERYGTGMSVMADGALRVRLFTPGFDTVAMDHTADEGFVVRAMDRADVLAAGAEALGAIMVSPVGVVPRKVLAVTLEAPGGGWADDERMIAWLSEVLYHMDVGRLALRRAVVLSDDASGVHGLLLGDTLDEARHAVRGAVKAVTWHALEVTGDPANGWRAQVVVDV